MLSKEEALLRVKESARFFNPSKGQDSKSRVLVKGTDFDAYSLLIDVVGGKQSLSQAALDKNPTLMLKKFNFTDPWTKEQFTNISALQYTWWAGNIGMFDMILDTCLTGDEQGEKIRRDALDQVREINDYFDLMPLCKALLFQKDYDKHEPCDKKRQEHWVTSVGAVQRNLPVHVREVYCSDPEPHSLTVYDKDSDKQLNWERELLGLGEKFAIYRGLPNYPCLASPVPMGLATKYDLKRITELSNNIIAGRKLLLEQLESPILIDFSFGVLKSPL